MPPAVNSYDDHLAQAAYALAQKWHTNDLLGVGTPGPADASAEDMAGWSSTQQVAFLDKLGDLRSMQPLTPAATQRLAELYGFSGSRNSEIRRALFLLSIKAGDDSVLPAVQQFLHEQGRMKVGRTGWRRGSLLRC